MSSSILRNAIAKRIPVNLYKSYLERFRKILEGTDLTYCVGRVCFRKEPWVIDFEAVSLLAGSCLNHFERYKKTIEKLLKSEYCKRVITYTEAARISFLRNLDFEGYEHKLMVIPPVTTKKEFVKEYTNVGKSVRLLFVASSNIPNQFVVKGGGEVDEERIPQGPGIDHVRSGVIAGRACRPTAGAIRP